MKTNIIRAVLPGLLLSAWLTGCSDRQVVLREGEDERVKIRLSASLSATKGAVGSLEELDALPEKFGIYGADTRLEDAAQTLGEEWGNPMRMDNVRAVGIDTLGRITLERDYTYDRDESSYVKFCAYSPYAPTGKQTAGGSYVESPTAGRAPTLQFALNGRQDLMWAAPVTGNKLTVPRGFVFEHLLTQLRFQIADAAGTMEGYSVKAIIFSGVGTLCSVDLETGEMGEWTAPTDDITLDIPAPVPVTGKPEAPQPLGSEIMLPPGQEYFTIRVVTDRDVYRNIRIRPAEPEKTFRAGKAYLITLSFNVSDQPGGDPTDIKVGVSLKAWEKGGYSDADV